MLRNITGKRPTVLWADDDPDEIFMMREVLQLLQSEHEIIEASDGRNVVRYLEQAREVGEFPSLIVLDINMPVLNGRETLAYLKGDKTFEKIPIVVFTTSSNPLDKEFCERYHTEMLTKPIIFTALVEIVQKLLLLCAVAVESPELS